MTTVSMLPVTLPRFAPSGPTQSTAHQTSQASVWAAANGDNQNGEALDFDILAEYLLDDNAAVGMNTLTGMPQFDFSDATNGSGVVSPEQSEDGSPFVEAANPYVTATNVNYSAPTGAPGPIPPQPHVLAPVPQMTSQAPVPPQSGVPMAPAPGVSAFPALPNSIPQMSSTQGVVVHHHAPPPTTTIPNNKKRRIDGNTPSIPNGRFVPGRGRQKSQAQIDRRRERNRILARRTRLRKKFFFESLQKEVTDLQRENSVLKEIARKKLPQDVSKKLLEECKAMEQLPSAVQEAVGEGATDMDSQDFNLVRSIQQSQQCFIITDPSLQDNPIVYASDDFLTLTGYQRKEVLGRNCRFLQGTETSPQKVEQVRKAISLGEDTTVTIINYTADGTAFWNKLFIAALRDAQNNIVNYIGVIVKVAAPEEGDTESGKRLPIDPSTQNNEEGNVSSIGNPDCGKSQVNGGDNVGNAVTSSTVS